MQPSISQKQRISYRFISCVEKLAKKLSYFFINEYCSAFKKVLNTANEGVCAIAVKLKQSKITLLFEMNGTILLNEREYCCQLFEK